MDKEVYEKLCAEWDEFTAHELDYYKELEDLANRSLNFEEYEKLRYDVDKKYGRTGEEMFTNPLFWGPCTKITELQDLTNPDFKLPGRCDKSFLDLRVYPEILEHYGEVVETEEYGPVRVLGFLYDSTDDYIYVQEVKTGIKRGVFKL